MAHILNQIVQSISIKKRVGDLSIAVSTIEIDSRKVTQGAVFIAIKGELSDGHIFINKAIELGAVAIVCEIMPVEINPKVAYVLVSNSQEAAALMGVAFYNDPSSKLKLVGVTGTNGKTTIATVLFKLFRKLGYSCGLISTVQNQINDKIIPATHTTPDAISLNALLQQMLDSG
jgi:UDP-N-acetylmuramoyl-L-alanyl-D-glutamate--2,6-diaminopimelate ligase